MNIEQICASLKAGSALLSLQSADKKNKALSAVASAIGKRREAILSANKTDTDKARAGGMSDALIERLALDNKKIDGILKSIQVIISQTDPVGIETAGWTTPNGMTIRQVRVPMGIVAVIYESRPNVTADAFALAYKSGNAVLLRGSSSALNSNKAIVSAIKEGLNSEEADGCGIADAVELAPCESREEVTQILNAVGMIDVALPRGGAGLINAVVSQAKIPVIQTGAGVCHLFVDESADLRMAADIAFNAKTQRPGACNAIECVLVHQNIASSFLPILADVFAGKVELRADEECYSILSKTMTGRSDEAKLIRASDADWGFEFLDMKCSVRVVSGVDEAVLYINAHNTKHSDCIVTEDRSAARIFQAKVDAACVYVNCSTRFTDGGEFGFGAELGISTQKLHARGPMGAQALTTTKFLIDGDGQVRE